MDECFLPWSAERKLLSGGEDLFASNAPLWCNTNFKDLYNHPDTSWWMGRGIHYLSQVYEEGTFVYFDALRE